MNWKVTEMTKEDHPYTQSCQNEQRELKEETHSVSDMNEEKKNSHNNGKPIQKGNDKDENCPYCKRSYITKTPLSYYFFVGIINALLFYFVFIRYNTLDDVKVDLFIIEDYILKFMDYIIDGVISIFSYCENLVVAFRERNCL
ncbi:hypothetical protein COBT_002441 [Conglomerata obtusa]